MLKRLQTSLHLKSAEKLNILPNQRNIKLDVSNFQFSLSSLYRALLNCIYCYPVSMWPVAIFTQPKCRKMGLLPAVAGRLVPLPTFLYNNQKSNPIEKIKYALI